MEPTLNSNPEKLNQKINKFVTVTLLIIVIIAAAIYMYQHIWAIFMADTNMSEQHVELTNEQREQILSNLESSANPVSDQEALDTLKGLDSDKVPAVSETARKDILKSL